MKKILRYYRNTLVDTDRMKTTPQSGHIKINKEDLEMGTLSPEHWEDLLKEYIKAINKAKRNKKTQKEITEDAINEGIPILITPYLIHPRKIHYEEKGQQKIEGTIRPLWIQAKVSKGSTSEIKLCPQKDKWPWITRDYLEPTFSKRIILGDLGDVEKYMTKYVASDTIWDKWNTLLDFAIGLYKSLPGTHDKGEYETLYEPLIFIDTLITGTTINLRNLLEHLESMANPPQLLKLYLANKAEAETPVLGEKANTYSIKHYGQMSNNFPLNPSQREALHHYLAMQDNEILAVNGPPGTGKTTLLHSIIATPWVDAALKGINPPIVIATSANNQAVTNIIRSFSEVINDTKNPSILTQRWISRVKSFGLYFPSKDKWNQKEYSDFLKAGTNYNEHKTFPSLAGFPGDVEKPENINEAEKEYLQCAEEYLGKKTSDVISTVKQLHTVMQAKAQELKKTIEKPGLLKSQKETIMVKLKERYESYLNPDLCRKSLLTISTYYEKLLKSNTEAILKLKGEIPKLEKEKNKLVWERRIVLSGYKLPWYMRIFGDLFGSRRQHLSAYLMANGLSHWVMENTHNLNNLLTIMRQEEKKFDYRLQEIQEEIQKLVDVQKKLDDDIQYNQSAIKDLDRIEAEENESLIAANPEKLDMGMRNELFWLAAHYWEGRWILEAREITQLAMQDKLKNISSRERALNRLRRFFMLTPCAISTLYTMPKVMAYPKWVDNDFESDYLLGHIDTLIIDEAGQVSPELGAGPMAMAKKAVIVGDVMQIEPVRSITQPVDMGNLKAEDIISSPDEFEKFSSTWLAASNGTIMHIAQKACRFRKEGHKERGMFLNEHWRCLTPIISYCNELAYSGRLIPKRPYEHSKGALPPFGYLYVKGTSEPTGTSRKNIVEAETVLNWLISNIDKIINSYNNKQKTKPFKDMVAVVTPFTAQKIAMHHLLRKKEFEKLRDITIGTVHSLQGAERDVVVFSPVYTSSDGHPGNFFFNSNLSMLNVAVSRAKNSFVVIGDTDIFKTQDRLPSGLLGKYLFADKRYNLLN